MDFEREEAEKAFSRNYKMWNEENAYNSPMMQMRRLEQAGLNPNLAYGSLASGAAGSPPQYQPVSYAQPSDAAYQDPFAPISQMGANLQNSSFVMAQTAKTLSENDRTKEEYNKLVIENSQLPDMLKVSLNNAVLSGKLTNKQIDGMARNITILDQQIQQGQISIDAAKENLNILRMNKEKVSIELDIEKALKESKIAQGKALSEFDVEKLDYYKKLWKKLLTEKDYDLRKAANDLYHSDLYTNAVKSRQSIMFQGYQNDVETYGNKAFSNERTSYANNKTLGERLTRQVSVQQGLLGDFLFFTDEVIPRVNSYMPKIGYSKIPN